MNVFTLSKLRSHNAEIQQRMKEEGAILAEWDDLKDCNACGKCFKCYEDKNNVVKGFRMSSLRRKNTIYDDI